jgi:diguanylate cyclase (GGDEF)-like protein
VSPPTLGPSSHSVARVGLPRISAGFAAIHAVQALFAVFIPDLAYRAALISVDAASALIFAVVAFMTATHRLPGWRRDAAAATVPIIAAAVTTVRVELLTASWPAVELVMAVAAAIVVSARSWFWSVIGACGALWAGCVVAVAIHSGLTVLDAAIWTNVAMLMAVAAGLALAARRARTDAGIALVEANRQLMEQAVKDPLTGVGNRKGLELVARPMIDLARRQGQAVHCLVLDIDTLRDVKADHGIREGDEVLLAVAEALRSATRATDVVARIGGDEFAMLGPGTGTSPLEMERRVRAHLAAVPALPRSSWQGKVSAGSATLVPWDAGDLESLLARAEQDLALRRSLKRRAAARMASDGEPEPEAPAEAAKPGHGKTPD